RYRILMPSLVSFLNQNLKIGSFLGAYYEDVDKKSVQLNFGMINVLALAFTAFMLFHYCLRLGFSKWEGLIGSCLFLTSFFVVTYYTVPMVDSLASFFLMAGFLAELAGSHLWIFVSLLLGLFTKETALVIVPLIMLTERRFFSKKLLACLPAAAIYAVFIMYLSPLIEKNDLYIFRIVFDPVLLKKYVLNGFREFTLYSVIEYLQTFMFLWFLALYALVRLKGKIPVFIRRSSWLFLLIFIVPFIVGCAAVGRVAFYLFPIAIPLALTALKNILVPGKASE
ncbi:MAG: hypothetical protein PHR11_00890, partial [Candidatus Omnitrophica bacterium]|nr:hypothetical protein [Candidatus Omnitrophota bacterium]